MSAKCWEIVVKIVFLICQQHFALNQSFYSDTISYGISYGTETYPLFCVLFRVPLMIKYCMCKPSKTCRSIILTKLSVNFKTNFNVLLTELLAVKFCMLLAGFLFF